ncbi:MAG: methanogen output domain 1-containing protein [Methanosarcinales archaeon]
MSEKSKILIVEDEKSVQKYLQTILKNNYNIVIVNNGLEAKEKLLEENFDMVITDLRMPEMNGKELIEWIHKKDKDIINLIITGYSEDWAPSDATDQQVYHYLKKGEFSPEELLKVVNNGLKLRKLRLREKEYQHKLELQYQIKTTITNVVPLLVASASASAKNMFIREMCNQVENILWNKYLSEVKEIDMNILGKGLVKIMNELGGDFEIYKVDDMNCIIKGKECPWVLEAQRNPVLCMLCRCIFTRISIRVFDKVLVNLDNTIGNRDDYCLIKIERY